MEEIINTLTLLKVFFEEPGKEFYIREVARILKRNHTSVRKYLNNFVKQGFLKLNKQGIYPTYSVDLNEKFLNLKIYYNLEKLRISGIIKDLEKFYEYPTIVLFGSYIRGIDDKNSDIDIFVLSEIKKEFKTENYEKKLNRKINLHLFTKEQFNKMIREKSQFINSLCNGFVLSGKLEVLK